MFASFIQLYNDILRLMEESIMGTKILALLRHNILGIEQKIFNEMFQDFP